MVPTERNIALLGPTYPFRGGIVHHTTCLVEALRQKSATTVVGYRNVFPRALYPGKTQHDPSQLGPRINAPRVFDPLAPLSWVRTSRLLQENGPDLFLLQYWHPYFAPALLGLIRHLRITAPQVRVGLFCHNALPHDPFPFQSILGRHLFGNCDLLFTHGTAGTAQLRTMAPGSQCVPVAHPVYRPLRWGDLPSPDRARSQLGLPVDRPMLLMFGHLRPYKNPAGLLDALALIPKEKRPTVLIAGAWLMRKKTFLRRRRALALEDTVRLHDGYVPNEALNKYFAAADAVVLPYRNATQSGAVHLAFAFDRPVIVTDVGSLAEAVDDGQTGRVVAPNNPHALAQAIDDMIIQGGAADMRQTLTRKSVDDGWAILAQQIRDAL